MKVTWFFFPIILIHMCRETEIGCQEVFSKYWASSRELTHCNLSKSNICSAVLLLLLNRLPMTLEMRYMYQYMFI